MRIVDLDDIVGGPRPRSRKDFILSEAVAIKRALEPRERAAGEGGQAAGVAVEKFSKGCGGRTGCPKNAHARQRWGGHHCGSTKTNRAPLPGSDNTES